MGYLLGLGRLDRSFGLPMTMTGTLLKPCQLEVGKCHSVPLDRLVYK